MRLLLGHAASQGRAVVTDNIPDFFACHQQRLDLHQTHWRLLFLINDTFARHRHDLFVSHVVAALETQLDAHPGDEDSSWIRWLAMSPEDRVGR